MRVHLFGGIWSPSCAQYALQRTFRDYGHDYDQDVNRAERNFYVDDLLLSVTKSEKACWIAEDLRGLFKRGGFHLTKWLSNDRRVMQSIPREERHKSIAQVDLGVSVLPEEWALGVFMGS